ncbi:uncharacterized protein LOC134244707 [Saccostrea cucullata]|uniref:uncharacterized protein LOC134244707 n=1 Tax=Saccostrea cuccullata TaxID=36930 RepID=UPI002ED224C0
MNVNLTEQMKAASMQMDVRNVINNLKNDLDLLNSTSTLLVERNSKLQQHNTILQDKLDSLNATYILSQQNATTTEDLKRLENILTFEIEQTVSDREQEMMKNISVTIRDLKLRDRYLTLSLMDVYNNTSTLKSLLSHFEEQQKMTDIEIRKLELSQNSHAANMNASLSRLQNSFESRVAFTAGRSFSRPTFTPGEIIVFDKIVYQVGGGYNPTKGVFTAPKAGLYVIFCTVVANSDNTFWTKIKINGVVKAGVMAVVTHSNADVYQSASNLVVHQLQVGDRVWIEMYTGTTMYSEFPDTTFSVIMIN